MKQFDKKFKATAALVQSLSGKGTMKDKAADCGVSRTTLWRYCNKAELRELLTAKQKAEVQKLLPKAIEKLSAKAMKGNIRAIELLFKTIGLIPSTEQKIIDIILSGVTPDEYSEYYYAVNSK
ncbi:MAG: phBC6A51 family helix-turn-helix protein [Candidatus Hermodarchaeia archaeon]|jgi:transcriptional regulator with AAA-type ATPase domain